MEETWMSVPEAAEELGVRQRDVRRMIEEKALLAVRRGDNNALAIHSLELAGEPGAREPLASLRGTLIRLSDAGFDDDEAMEWLLSPNELLGGESPIGLLQAGNVHGVRRAIF